MKIGIAKLKPCYYLEIAEGKNAGEEVESDGYETRSEAKKALKKYLKEHPECTEA